MVEWLWIFARELSCWSAFSVRLTTTKICLVKFIPGPWTQVIEVCAPFWAADGSALLILPLVDSFHDRWGAVLLSRWQHIAHSSAHQWISQWFGCQLTQRIAAYRSFFRSSRSLTVCALFCSADCIAPSSAHGQLSRRASHSLTERMAVDCSFFRSSTAFTVCPPFCTADSSVLLVHLLVNSFPVGLHAVLLWGWQRIAHSSARQWLSRFACRFAPQMAADCSLYCSSTAFPMVYTPYCSVDGIGLLTPPLINGFHDGLRVVLLSGWYRIVHTSARQLLSWQFPYCIAQWMAADCSFFYLSMAFTVCTPFCSVYGSVLLILLLVNGFHRGLHAVLHRGW